MDQYKQLYTSFAGRIGRKQFWIGMVGLLVANIVIGILILPVVGLGMVPDMAAQQAGAVDVEEAARLIGQSMSRSAWASLLLLTVFALPTLAVSIKRRRDRNKSGMDVVVYYVLAGVVQFLVATGIGVTTTDFQGVMLPTPNLIVSLLSLGLGLFGLYLFVTMGFLRGTNGPNDFGPDPLRPASRLAA